MSLTLVVLALGVIKLSVLPMMRGHDIPTWNIASRLMSPSSPDASKTISPPGPVRRTKYLFVFGNSYTSTGFHIEGLKPSTSNPLGNPPLPGDTTSGGLTWPGFLATELNTSLVLTYVFAVGGATVDNSVIPGYFPWIPSVSDQVETWTSNLQSKPPYAPWTAENALFAVWIGINDIGMTYSQPEEEARLSKALDRYFTILCDLYHRGARNFALLNVPPTDKTPVLKLDSNVELLVSAITFWNSQLPTRVAAFKRANREATVTLVDTQEPFNMVLRNPEHYGAPNADCFNSDGKSCLWHDGYHPGLAIQKVVAQTVAKAWKGSFF